VVVENKPGAGTRLAAELLKNAAPILHVASFHFGLAVPGEAPHKTLAEFIAWLKANPAKANFGMPAAGSLPHFFGLPIGRVAGSTSCPCPSITVRPCWLPSQATKWPS
jgi:tripartite-type tricarboxylate transporter receptor subunit TctC